MSYVNFDPRAHGRHVRQVEQNHWRKVAAQCHSDGFRWWETAAYVAAPWLAAVALGVVLALA